jgi:hypothetical protein
MPRKLGTLVVVVLRAVSAPSLLSTACPSHRLIPQRNLPNKQRIGKQDPYCTVTHGSEQKRTKIDKKGGQHPRWDEEFRFEIWEDMADEMGRQMTASGGVLPNKTIESVAKKSTKGSKSIAISVYADDPKDPDLIGDAVVDITGTLKHGEFDGMLFSFFLGLIAIIKVSSQNGSLS